MDPDRKAFEELTALFTTEDGSAAFDVMHDEDGATELSGTESPASESPATESTFSEPSASEIQITVAICGHLPVMAGLWVTQYADRIGERCGSTGLLRLEGGRCSLELFRTPKSRARVEQGSSLIESIQTVGEGITRWIVCVDDVDSAEAIRAGAHEVVVLTGADKPAVLAAYRIAKMAAARVSVDASLELGLVVVGAGEQRTRAVGEVLATAATEYMDRPLEVVESIHRMDVVESARRLLFAERERATPSEAIAALLKLVPTPTKAEDQPTETVHDMPDEPTTNSELTEDVDPVESVRAGLRYIDSPSPAKKPDLPVSDGPRREVRLTPRLSESEAVAQSKDAIEFGVVAEVARIINEHDSEAIEEIMDPIEVDDVELSAPEDDSSALTKENDHSQELAMGAQVSDHRSHSDHEEGLGAHFPEFTSIEFRCPIARMVELALDESGTLRLLCRDTELAHARMAASWAKSNDALLCAAVPGIHSISVEPTISLVTESAENVADLHRTGVRLHLLTALDIEGHTRWIRVDLNSDESAQIP